MIQRNPTPCAAVRGPSPTDIGVNRDLDEIVYQHEHARQFVAVVTAEILDIGMVDIRRFPMIVPDLRGNPRVCDDRMDCRSVRYTIKKS